jgi:hypothetical protein
VSRHLEPAALRDAVVARNLAPPALPRDELEATFDAVAGHAVNVRIASWARMFQERSNAAYVFGDEPGGYVAEGRLVDDRSTDCMLFTMRVFELAQSTSPEGAIERAVAGRFPGVPLDAIASADGRLDYTHPYRRRFAVELMEEGFYGTDVTGSIGPTDRDVAGGDHPRPVFVIPKDALDLTRFIDGDALWLVLDPMLERTRAIREESGAIIGHMGIVVMEGETPHLIHAAAKSLPGEYEGNAIVSVPVATYLERVETFSAVRVTRCW